MQTTQASVLGLRQWSASQVASADRTDAWRDELSANYGEWQVRRAVSPEFSASIRNRDFGGVRVVECVCDPCEGRRIAQLIERDRSARLGVQIIKAGSERFHFGNEVIEVGPGDLVIWTSDRPVEFTVLETLHKVSLVLPLADIQERLPRGSRFGGTVIDSRGGMGAVMFSHIDSLARQLDMLGVDDQAAVRRATLELLTATMSHRIEAPQRGLALQYLKQMQDYILANLQDERLSPSTIAAAHHMSPRYVHMLFGQIGISVSTWIRLQRLERCREDLRSRTHRDCSIAEIAYAWGFNDATHFSRAFKQQYGTSPRGYRERDPAAG
jgi:AraC-like DNA-binding protein